MAEPRRRKPKVSIERQLISKIVQDKDVHHVYQQGIRKAFFPDPVDAQVFDAIVRHHNRYGEVPSADALSRDFPKYDLVEVSDSLEYLTDAFRAKHEQSLINDAIGDVATAYDQGNLTAAKAVMSRVLKQIAEEVPQGKDVNLTETGDERMARYRALRDLDGGLLGIPTGFPSIDKATQGLQPGQLITFAGPPKAGKSTALLLAAMEAHRTAHRPLFIGFEMTNEEQSSRFDAWRANVDHSKLVAGELTKAELARVEREIKRAEGMRDFIVSSDIMSATTVSGIQAKIEEHQPDVLYVDGVYMMDDELGEPKGSSQALTNITRSLKRMALNLEIPIAISTQVLESKMEKRKVVTSYSIGYSSSFAQDSDALFAVQRTEDPEVNMFKILLARNAPPMEIFVRWDWVHGVFEEIEDPFDGDGATF